MATSTFTWKKNGKAPSVPSAPKAVPVFPFGGQELPDGGVRYRVRYQILCDNGGTDPSGVFFEKIVPPKSNTADYLKANADRDDAIKRLTKLVTPETKRPARSLWLTKKV